MDCWEFMECGRELCGLKVYELGICRAYPSDGKRCARIAGTLCGGKVQGTYAMKIFDCLECDFYKSEYYQHADLNSQVIVNCNCDNNNCDK
jgi:hypothetical protein